MAAYRRVYHSHHLQAAKNREQLWNVRSVIEYGLPLPFYSRYSENDIVATLRFNFVKSTF